MTKILNSKLIVILFVSFALFPAVTFAAVLYLEPAEGEFYQGDTFIVNARIDPEGECVNTIQADLEFSKDSLEVEDVSRGNSIISFWVKEPEFSNKTGFISFAGGIPGGFCGLLPGDPGESNLLGRIILKAKKMGGDPTSAQIKFLNSSQVLLNDGLGTPADLSFKKVIFTILPKPLDAVQGKQEWQEELEKDKTSPELFEIKINQDSSIFEGKYFITFYTADKQTGIDYYQIKEGKNDWQKAASPYLLEDQTLKSIIKVKAVDKAGNERIAEYAPVKPFPYGIVILMLVGIGMGFWFYRKSKIKSQKSK